MLRHLVLKDWAVVGPQILPPITRVVDDMVRLAKTFSVTYFLQPCYQKYCDAVQPTLDYLPRSVTLCQQPDLLVRFLI